ncbi:MAG: DUF2892 domain-containing protein [Chitinivibrionales bacterium]|nr:DUF2892 domain-containing protein [Chitinivibrionales bacterium]MBD3395253.1 DUF2892 domain-containing protein [Chitinivibrionales bacterium]
MIHNESRTDRIVRVILGAGIIGAGAVFQSWWGLVGLVPLITGFTGTCLLYKPFGISTRRRE